MKKESKAQRVERIKREKDGLDVITDIYNIAQNGGTIDPEDIDRLKWYGMYTQNNSLQDADDNTLYLMLRVKIEKGILSVKQLKTLGEISRDYARGSADLTTRQNLQFHFIQIKDLPSIFKKLEDVGLSSVMAAGDVVRNTITCALGSLSATSLIDVSKTVDEINEFFYKNREFSNLPRKFKIGVSGCSSHCMPHEIQDISFVAYRCDNSDIAFALYVGGGLASNKRFATYLGSVTQEQILPLVKACVEIFRDHGNRDKRNRARLGHLVQMWGEEKFKQMLQKISHIEISENVEPKLSKADHRHHHGRSDSTTPNSTHVGCTLFGGKLGSDMILQLSSIMQKYSIDELRTTAKQNLILCNINNSSLDLLDQDLKEIGIDSNSSSFRVENQACTGLDYCKFAIVETKALSKQIALHLEETIVDFNEPLRISINGCPNSCAHPNIATLGFTGASFKKDGVSIKGFTLLVGGGLDAQESRFSRVTKIRLSKQEIPSYIEGLILEYQRSNSSSFKCFIDEYFQS